MLQELRIRDLAIIDDLRVEFGPGLNILSGETGAGKSILVDALALATGGRASADLVRAGAQIAVVEAAFRIDARPDIRERLESLGLEAEEELIVRRTIAPGGKSRAFLNGSPLTQGMLAQVLEGLVEIDGQHEHQRLLRPETQLALLDRAARLQGLCGEVGGILRRWRELAGEGEGLRLSEEERLRQIDYLGFQITEISEADPQPGEDERLAAERVRLANAGRLAQSAGGAEALLYSGEGAVVESLGRAATALGEAARIDSALGDSAARIEGAQREIEDVATALRGYAEGLVFDPDRLADVETRLQTLKGLTRKYGPRIEDVIVALARAQERLAGFEAGDERLTKIDAECEALREAGMAKARKLSVARVRAGKALSRKIQAELGALGMLKAVFEVEVSEEALPAPGFGEQGKDRVVFNFSANPGEPSRALARIASGGELSRTMLAIRNILFDADLPGVLVFDEADAGVGGKVADAVGERLSDLASKHQVLCLTHLPQIAARGDRHLRVSKMSLGGRTVARLVAVEGAARVEEIARMSGGARISEPTRAHARDLLRRARPGGLWDGKICSDNK